MNRTPIHVKHDIIPYCATCKKQWDADEKRRLRQRFICTEDKGESEPHIAACVKGDVGKKWLHIERFIIDYEFKTINTYKKYFKTSGPLQNIAIYFVIITSFIALQFHKTYPVFIALSSVIGILHLLLLSTSITFFSRFPAHPLRSVINTLHSFFLIVLFFGLIYFSYKSKINFDREIKDVVDAIYFSMVTITTLGYGEIKPVSILGKIMVMVELGVGIYLLAIILTVFTSWINDAPEIADLPTYYELFPERLDRNNEFHT